MLLQRPVLSCLVMENPWSVDNMTVYPTEEQVAASGGAIAPNTIKAQFPLSLRRRHFMRHHPVGKSLWHTKQHYCNYGHLQHAQKPTAIFSDVIVVPETPCICGQCNASVKRQHVVQVDRQTNGDAERAVWPDALVLRIFRLFNSHVHQELQQQQ